MDAIKANSENGEKKRCYSCIFYARYEGEVELRAVCLNSRRVVHYDTVKSTTRVKEENEALLLLLFERVFIRLGHGSVVEKIEVNGEIGSVNAGGVNDHMVMGEAIGYGRCIVKSKIIYFQ